MIGRIGIMGAMPEEIGLLLPRLSCRKEHIIGRRTFISGKINGNEVVIVFSRMGKVAASSTVTTLINLFGCDIILFTGVAGALDRKLNVGDIVISSSLVQHDMNVSALPEFKRFEVPLLEKQYFSPPEWLIQIAEEAADGYLSNVMHSEIETETLSEFGIKEPKIKTGLVASGDQFIASEETCSDLRKNLPGVLCVEMEGAAVAQVAYEYDLPYIVVRTISDKADHSAHLDYPLFVKRVASHLTCGVLLELLKILYLRRIAYPESLV